MSPSSFRRKPTVQDIGIPDMVGNIPGSLFMPGNEGVFETSPGQRLLYTFETDNLSLSYYPKQHRSDINYPHFSAHTGGKKHETSLYFSVRSLVKRPSILSELRLDPKHPRHPDLYPKRLLDASLRYFEYCQGRPLRFLVGTWGAGDIAGDSVNFEMYHKTLREASHLPPEERRQFAAFSTWTGKQALRHGFSVVNVGHIGKSVYPYFERPSSPRSQVLRKLIGL